MAEQNLVQFRQDISNVNNKNVGVMDLKEIADMTTPEFIMFQNRIVNFRKYRRYDTVIWKSSVAITPDHKGSLFSSGVGETVQYANDASDDIKKTLVHTNMPKKGQYQPGELAIIHSIEAIVGFQAGKPNAAADGVVSAPHSTSFPTNIDIFTLENVVQNQFNLAFYRGNKNLIVQGLVQDFPQTVGMSGSSGAHPGAFAQNTGFGLSNLMHRPQVIEGQEDFEIEAQPLAPSLDFGTAARDVVIKVVYNSWELLKNYS